MSRSTRSCLVVFAACDVFFPVENMWGPYVAERSEWSKQLVGFVPGCGCMCVRRWQSICVRACLLIKHSFVSIRPSLANGSEAKQQFCALVLNQSGVVPGLFDSRLGRGCPFQHVAERRLREHFGQGRFLFYECTKQSGYVWSSSGNC